MSKCIIVPPKSAFVWAVPHILKSKVGKTLLNLGSDRNVIKPPPKTTELRAKTRPLAAAPWD